MYRKADKAQMSIADFFTPFGGTLDENNRYIVLMEKKLMEKKLLFHLISDQWQMFFP